MVGQYALGLAICAPVFMFTNLQLRGVQATDAKEEYSFVDYHSLRLLGTTFGLLVVVGIAVASGYAQQTVAVIVLVGLAKAFESLSDVYYGFAQRHERLDVVARSMMYKGVLSLAAMALLMYITRSIVLASAGVAAAWMIRFLAYDMRIPNIIGREIESSQRIRLSRIWPLFKLALPLGFVMMLISLNANIPRYFIQDHLGERELGYYSALAYLVVAGTTVVSALGQSATPRLATFYSERKVGEFRFLINKLVLVGGLLGMSGILVSLIAGKLILSLIYTPEYAAYATLLTFLFIGAALQYVASFLGYGMTAARRFRVQLPLFFFVTFTTLAASYLLIPVYGLIGAAISVLIAAGIQIVLSLIVNKRALRAIRGLKTKNG